MIEEYVDDWYCRNCEHGPLNEHDCCPECGTKWSENFPEEELTGQENGVFKMRKRTQYRKTKIFTLPDYAMISVILSLFLSFILLHLHFLNII